MPELQLSDTAQHWMNVVLLWLGLGILAGLLARFILPGRRPSGAAGTLVIGIVGSTVGPLALSLFLHNPGFNPISPLGVFAAVAGSVLALLIYRLFVVWRLARLEEDDVE